MTNELDPREALALAERTRERMAARAATPSWYAPLYGLFCGMLVMGATLPQPAGISIVALAIVMLGLLYQRWTQISGLSVSGYRAGATRVIAIGLGIAMVGLIFAGLALRETMGLEWAPVACGAVGALIAAFASAAWDRAWRDGIRRSGDSQ
jgi:hypothetical protein